jgi:hypothetical protein
MAIIIHHSEYAVDNSIENFLDLFYSKGMKYFASDLLQKGFSTKDIQDAIKRAVTVGRTSGMEIRKHFAPVYTQIDGQLVNDCKLTRMGYALVILNARPGLKATSEWQLKVLENFFE